MRVQIDFDINGIGLRSLEHIWEHVAAISELSIGCEPAAPVERAPVEVKPKKKRRTKAEVEADKAAEESAPPEAPPEAPTADPKATLEQVKTAVNEAVKRVKAAGGETQYVIDEFEKITGKKRVNEITAEHYDAVLEGISVLEYTEAVEADPLA